MTRDSLNSEKTEWAYVSVGSPLLRLTLYHISRGVADEDSQAQGCYLVKKAPSKLFIGL